MTYQSMGLATLAGGFALALAPLPTANADLVTDTVSFNYQIYGPVWATPVESWFISHDFDLTYDSSSGFFSDETINVDFTFVVDGEEFTVDGTYQRFTYGSAGFEASIEIPEAPLGYGPMTLEIGGPVVHNAFAERWSGNITAGITPGNGFSGETYDVDFNAQVVPAPGALALFGCALLAGRRRRD